MIKSFGNPFAEAAWNGRYAKGIPNDVMRVAARKLLQVNAAVALDDLRVPPGNRLELLSLTSALCTAVISTTLLKWGAGSAEFGSREAYSMTMGEWAITVTLAVPVVGAPLRGSMTW